MNPNMNPALGQFHMAIQPGQPGSRGAVPPQGGAEGPPLANEGRRPALPIANPTNLPTPGGGSVWTANSLPILSGLGANGNGSGARGILGINWGVCLIPLLIGGILGFGTAWWMRRPGRRRF